MTSEEVERAIEILSKNEARFNARLEDTNQQLRFEKRIKTNKLLLRKLKKAVKKTLQEQQECVKLSSVNGNLPQE